MPILKCEICKGSGFKGIHIESNIIDENTKIEFLILEKCEAHCKNGLIYIIDDSSYNVKDISG